MIYLSHIASFKPISKISNFDRLTEFDIDKDFLKDKIGVENIFFKEKNQDTSDLCFEAFSNLKSKYPNISNKIDCLIVCTQNPDGNGIPHTSSILHKKLGLSDDCACFDISLGCSGYVYGLSILKGFMEENSFSQGLLFTCDPYSKIIDPLDKNTSLLFSDAATVTLLSRSINSTQLTSKLKMSKFLFATRGKEGEALNNDKSILKMDGRKIFNFAAKEIPIHITHLLNKVNLKIDDIDYFLFHQGSKAILDFLQKKISISEKKIYSNLYENGNTVSSSIPILLEELIDDKNSNKIILSGFGVGLSWATALLERGE